MKRNCVRTCMESSLFFSLTREMVGNNHHIFFLTGRWELRKADFFFFYPHRFNSGIQRHFTYDCGSRVRSVCCWWCTLKCNSFLLFQQSLFFCLFVSKLRNDFMFFFLFYRIPSSFFFLILNKKKKPIHMHIIYISVFFYRRSGCFGLFFFFCSPVSIRVHTLATSHCCKASTLFFFFCFDLSPLPYVPCQKRKAKRQVTRLSSVVQMSWWDWVVWRWKQSPRIQINIHLPWIMIPSELRCKGFTAHSRVIFLFNERIQLNESYSARNDSFASANHVKNTHIFFF